MNIDKKTIEELVKIAESASIEILKIYQQPEIESSNKVDESPLTQADLISDRIILAGLKKISDYPIISEETYKNQDKSKLKNYWLVDPLDGTKDFLAKNDEFTINIALINDYLPVLGLIYLPAKRDYYWAIRGLGSYKNQKKIFNQSKRKGIIGTASRFYRTIEDQNFFDKNGIKKIVTSGASLKFCQIAEGLADVYPRHNGSSEWDIAAGHIILKEAGCNIISLRTNKEISYRKKSIRNDFFVVSRNNLNFL
jgi:3'(2'), 5'-bisphosphate nucleotidase